MLPISPPAAGRGPRNGRKSTVSSLRTPDAVSVFIETSEQIERGADREREQARQNPERTTLLLAAAGAALTLGPDHSATKALAKASITMDRVDLWHARLALQTLRRDQREAIAKAAES